MYSNTLLAFRYLLYTSCCLLDHGLHSRPHNLLSSPRSLITPAFYFNVAQPFLYHRLDRFTYTHHANLWLLFPSHSLPSDNVKQNMISSLSTLPTLPCLLPSPPLIASDTSSKVPSPLAVYFRLTHRIFLWLPCQFRLVRQHLTSRGTLWRNCWLRSSRRRVTSSSPSSLSGFPTCLLPIKMDSVRALFVPSSSLPTSRSRAHLCFRPRITCQQPRPSNIFFSRSPYSFHDVATCQC